MPVRARGATSIAARPARCCLGWPLLPLLPLLLLLLLPSCHVARRGLAFATKSAIGLSALTSTETMTLACPADGQRIRIAFDVRVAAGTVRIELTDPEGKVRWQTTTAVSLTDERGYDAIAGTWTFAIGMDRFTGDYHVELNASSEHDS